MAKPKSIKEALESSAIELATGITSEKLNPLFFSEDDLKAQPEPLFRLDEKGHRYYYRWDGEEPVFYTSVTTLIRNTLPTPPSLIQWMKDKGDESSEIAMDRANYGTFMHSQIALLLINGKYNLDELPKKLETFIAIEKPTNTEGWLDDLKKDILAFAQFIIDRNVKPLAIEICLYHPDDGYAGAVDLVCSLDFNKKRINAIIDMKSGRKSFYQSHEIQLTAYKEMWQIHFPEVPIDKVMNWSPKDWRKTPSYNLKDQTGSVNACKLPHLVALAKIENEKRTNTITITSGEIDVLKGLERNIAEKTYTELIKNASKG